MAGADPGFCQGGPSASDAESGPFVARVQDPLKGPGSFWVLMLKYMHSLTL